MLEQRIEQQFIDSADLKYQAAQVLSKPMAAAIQSILVSVTGGGKVLACGNGGSAALAQLFAATFVGHHERERPELGAIALNTDAVWLTGAAHDYGFEHERELSVVALTGQSGGKIRQELRETDVHICVPSDKAVRIQEVHLLVLHGLCDGVDSQLLGEQETTE